MKKYFKFLLLFLLSTTLIFAKDFYISSFNTLRLGKAQKDYKLIGEVVENFDLVGLLEVMDEEGVLKLLKQLNKKNSSNWEYLISPYPVGKTSYKEYFAFIWKNKDIRVSKIIGYYDDKENIFSRQPFGVEFQIKDDKFTLVLVHSIFGKKESERRREAFKMIEVYNYFKNKSSNNKVIIAGDFNLSANDEAFEGLLQHKDGIIYTLNPMKMKTTLGKNSLANSYDNMFLAPKFLDNFKGKSGIINFATKKDLREIKNKISDHLPIFIVLEVDDDR